MLDIPGREAIFLSTGFVDAERSQAVQPDSLFQIGSQTKMFTSAAVLLLERDGKLKLSDPVSRYVAGVSGSAEVTLEQLLTHAGGIGDSVNFFDPPARRPDFPVSLADHLLLGRVAGQQFEAGTAWRYNNLGFIVLGRVVEVASGQPLDQFIQSRILQPLGMSSSWLGALQDYPESRMARGYYTESESREQVDSTVPDLSWASSAGDMVSNLPDMLRWFHALLSETSPIGISLADLQRGAVPTGSPGNMQFYGLGLMGRIAGGQLLWGHGGNIHGYVTLTLADPETGITIGVMTSLLELQDGLLPAIEGLVSTSFRLAELTLKNDSV
jgi:D-alanyl-D-alanine carboxypeptidase